MKNSVKIALLGIGNVGSGVWEILERNHDRISKYTGVPIEVKRVLVRDVNKKRNVSVPADLLTASYADIVDDPEIKIVVELMGGLNPAYDYIKQAIENKKSVVTANKAVISHYGRELIELARRNQVELRFEGSVGGGIPIINTLNKSLAANEIDTIVGIINGTTNYILTQMTNQGVDFDTALKMAQQKGYAEADPSSDIDGEDAAFKLSILTFIAFGVQVPPQDIPREGITRISEKDIQYAAQLGYTIKLLATAKKHDGKLDLHVHPALVPNNHPLAAVNDEFNALFIKGDAIGEFMMYGKGAGSLPTGSAVMGDIMDIAAALPAGSPSKLNRLNGFDEDVERLKINGEGWGEYYIRLEVVDRPGVLGKISTALGNYEVSIASVVQRGRGERIVPLILITHRVEKRRLNQALEEIQEFDVVDEVASILRVEECSG
ncbi:MAG: homoserine dehydrogenase [Clostridiales bacterium]|jgi:homoserine dehydrogenase|nr:homoserine dehydrogenase [Clostridiales bacterium]